MNKIPPRVATMTPMGLREPNGKFRPIEHAELYVLIFHILVLKLAF